MATSSLRSLFAYAGALFGTNPGSASDIRPSYEPLSGAPSCPISGPMSCHNSTPVEGSCCFVHPGGRILLTQFWDQQVHAGGAEEDWTLHGLWYAPLGIRICTRKEGIGDALETGSD